MTRLWQTCVRRNMVLNYLRFKKKKVLHYEHATSCYLWVLEELYQCLQRNCIDVFRMQHKLKTKGVDASKTNACIGRKFKNQWLTIIHMLQNARLCFRASCSAWCSAFSPLTIPPRVFQPSFVVQSSLETY